jgi:hypothetical protein
MRRLDIGRELVRLGELIHARPVALRRIRIDLGVEPVALAGLEDRRRSLGPKGKAALNARPLRRRLDEPRAQRGEPVSRVGISGQRDVMRRLRGRRDRVGVGRLRLEYVGLVARLDRVQRVVHGEVGHREGAVPEQGEPLVGFLGGLVDRFIPRCDETGLARVGSGRRRHRYSGEQAGQNEAPRAGRGRLDQMRNHRAISSLRSKACVVRKGWEADRLTE